MKRFKSPRQAQRFLSIHDQIANVFPRRRRNHDTAASLRSDRTQAFATWADVTGIAIAASRIARPIALSINLQIPS
jgi:putative transposase